MTAIKVAGVGKAYKIYRSRWGRLVEWIVPGSNRHELRWVLHDISFDIEPGEAVGLMGVNGAGKSTLLKIITGTTRATKGQIAINGSVAALLELGMGFHPDFTGRQNVYMAGQLLGLTNHDVDRLMPEIEEFAEIGEYIDQPVRVYSSGMQMRLAFSIATARRPDILIVDEALSVGDAYFQHKSFDRIRKFREQGTTLLLVSHDKTSIQSICDKAILLEKGTVSKIGPPEEVIDFYNASLAQRQSQTIRQEVTADGNTRTISGTGEATVEHIALYDGAGNEVEMVDVGSSAQLEITVRANAAIPKLVLGYMIKNRLGQDIYGTNTYHTKQIAEDVKAGECLKFTFAFDMNVGPGSYSVATALTSGSDHLTNNYEWRDYALVFTVANLTRPFFLGFSFIEPTIRIERQ
ncbi:sugar ABC transporter ATP-binding protein [Burkholderia sp. Nafp2/4-1b]|uniref:ABC transporter ATP-binding protein n=1 Tax=Burkholderia sp. Nafp2/4-1b TaxID=2116686 RepID=UPI000EF873A5|nr:ABC transporter ATP-binding protein [Burkholderia sp. Nafp2/4-1b]RKU01392.1 sugar ABC transporter ATP-binding protein [Burkholderia sp. Nafp2/4-1b]